MDIRLFILSLACLSCVVPSLGGVLTAKLLAKKAIGAGAAIVAGKAALIKEGLGVIAGSQSPDCIGGAFDKVHSIIDSKKKLFGNIIGLKQKIADVVEKKTQFIEGISKPDVFVYDVSQGPVFVDGPAPLVEIPHRFQFSPMPQGPIVELPPLPPRQIVELPPLPHRQIAEFPLLPHREVVEFSPVPHHEVVELPPRSFPSQLYPVPPPPPLHSDRIYPAEAIPIRELRGDC